MCKNGGQARWRLRIKQDQPINASLCLIIQIIQRDLKRGDIQIEGRFQLRTEVMGGVIGGGYFLKTAALTPYISQPPENVC